MTKEEYYRSLAEIQLREYEDFHIQINNCMIAKGILIKMQSDLNLFLKNNGPSESTENRKYELNTLMEIVEFFDKIASTNIQMKEVNKINDAWMKQVKEENKLLRQENSKLIGTLNGE